MSQVTIWIPPLAGMTDIYSQKSSVKFQAIIKFT